MGGTWVMEVTIILLVVSFNPGYQRGLKELRRRLERYRAGLRPTPRQVDGDDVDIDALVEY